MNLRCLFGLHTFVWWKPVDSYKKEPVFTDFCIRCGTPRPASA